MNNGLRHRSLPTKNKTTISTPEIDEDSRLASLSPSELPWYRRKQRAGLASLPTELHIAISKLLPYPDALALKHTNRHFHSFVDTGIKVKVAWLVRRRELLLAGPGPDASCDLRNDLVFCTRKVKEIIRQRRLHIECETRPDIGCVVQETPFCHHRSTFWQRCKNKLWQKIGIELWLFPLVLIPLICSWVWFIELIGNAHTDSESTRAHYAGSEPVSG
ncbi:hypothetical protein CC79DRAFT_575757 [Sarocladium strictum]